MNKNEKHKNINQKHGKKIKKGKKRKKRVKGRTLIFIFVI